MKQKKTGYAHGSVVNIYCVYQLNISRVDSPDFTVQNAFFGGIKITKIVNTSNYKYSGYGSCFDGRSDFSIGSITNCKNIIIFGVEMSFSSHSTNKTQNIYVFGKDFVQELNNTIIYAEGLYKTNFTTPNKKFAPSLHFNGDDSYLFVNGV